MKKFICIISVITVIFAFTGCSNDKVEEVSSDIVSSIVYNSLVPEYASQGRIDTVEFAVGADVDEVVKYYNGNDPSKEGYGADGDSSDTETVSIPDLDEEIAYDLTIRGLDTGDRIIKMYSYDTRYFYYSASPESGIAYIAQSVDSFGYMIGHSTYDDVKSSIEAQPVAEKAAETDDMFFMVEPLDNSKILSYQYGDYMLNFFFDGNDKLFYTTIYNVHVWTE